MLSYLSKFTTINVASADSSTNPLPPPLPPSDFDSSTESPPPPPSASISLEIPKNLSSCPKPGPYEALTASVKYLTALDAFDGTRILINKQLSPQMLVGHNFFLGSTAFGPGKNTHFQFNAQVNASETLSVIGSLDIGGTAEGRIFKIVDNVTTKLHCACNPSQPEGDMMTLEAEYAGQTFNCTGKYGLAYGGSLAALSWCQSLTPSLVVGGEGTYIGSQQATSNQFGIRYSPVKSDWTGCLSYMGSQNLVFVNYKKIVTPGRVSLGSELMFEPSSKDSNVTLGAEFNLTQSKIATCVDGKGKVQSTLSTQLGKGGALNLLFSAEVDWPQDAFKFGYGVQIGG